MTELHCEMREDCTEPVTHLDDDGWVYCTEHGIERRGWKCCRKLRDWELRKLQRGEQLTHY